jgi:hypothetical protein
MTPLVGKIDAGKDLKQGGFAGAIPSDDAEKLSLLDLKAEVIQGAVGLSLITLVKLHEALTQGTASLLRETEGLGKVTDGDGGRHAEESLKDEG